MAYVRKRRSAKDRFQCDAPVSRDPTGTLDIRNRYKADIEFRWRTVRAATVAAVQTHDMFGLSSKDPSALSLAISLASRSNMQAPGQLAGVGDDVKVLAFQRWFDELLRRTMIDGADAWLLPMVERTFVRALTRAKKLSNVNEDPPDMHATVGALHNLAVVELQGIVEAVSQRAVREVSLALLHHDQPSSLGERITTAIQKIGVERSRAMVDVMVVKAHGQATLDQFAHAGIKKVGLIPETVPASKRDRSVSDAVGTGPGSRISREFGPSPSTIGRIAKAQSEVERILGEEVDILTAGDDDVCDECLDISDEGPYTINEARSLIPAHPHCRCAFIPADDERFASVHEEE